MLTSNLDRDPGVQRSRVDRSAGRGVERRGAWHEILVVDDGSTDETGERAAAAGARVIRHPYNKGNGAAVKTGIRQATGPFVLIIDADGQHRPADAARLVVASRRVRSRRRRALRPIAGQPSSAALGNELLNRVASYLAERPIPDLTSGFRAARRECLLEFLHLLPNGFSTPTTTTLAFLKAGYSVRFEPIEAAQRRGRVEDPARPGWRPLLPDSAQGHHDLQSAANLPADQRRRVRAGRGLRRLDDRHAVARDQFVGAADPAERRHPSGRPRLGADLVAALRGTRA